MNNKRWLGLRGPLYALTACAIVSLLTSPVPYTPTSTSDEDKARAEAYLAQYPPKMPPGWTWSSVALPRGLGDLRVGTTQPLGDVRGTVVFIPGFRGQLDLYGDTLGRLQRSGYRVVGVDLPGQGGSVRQGVNPEKPWTGDFHLYAEAVATAVADEAGAAPGPMVLVGESFGGHVALRTLADYPHLGIDGAVLLTPALAVNTGEFPPALVRVMTQTMTALGFGNLYGPGEGRWVLDWSVDPETYRCATREDRVYLQEAMFTLRPEYRVGGVTHGWLAGLTRSGDALSRPGALSNLSVPVHMILAGQDVVVLNEVNEQACTQSLKTCTMMTLPDAQHCLVLEPDETIDAVHAAIDRFVATIPEQQP